MLVPHFRSYLEETVELIARRTYQPAGIGSRNSRNRPAHWNLG